MGFRVRRMLRLNRESMKKEQIDGLKNSLDVNIHTEYKQKQRWLADEIEWAWREMGMDIFVYGNDEVKRVVEKYINTHLFDEAIPTMNTKPLLIVSEPKKGKTHLLARLTDVYGQSCERGKTPYIVCPIGFDYGKSLGHDAKTLAESMVRRLLKIEARAMGWDHLFIKSEYDIEFLNHLFDLLSDNRIAFFATCSTWEYKWMPQQIFNRCEVLTLPKLKASYFVDAIRNKESLKGKEEEAIKYLREAEYSNQLFARRLQHLLDIEDYNQILNPNLDNYL
jgi:hypothetical protein